MATVELGEGLLSESQMNDFFTSPLDNTGTTRTSLSTVSRKVPNPLGGGGVSVKVPSAIGSVSHWLGSGQYTTPVTSSPGTNQSLACHVDGSTPN